MIPENMKYIISLINSLQSRNHAQGKPNELQIARVDVSQTIWDSIKGSLGMNDAYTLSDDRTFLDVVSASEDPAQDNNYERVFLYSSGTANPQKGTILIYGGNHHHQKQREQLYDLVKTALNTSGNAHISVEMRHVPSNTPVFTFDTNVLLQLQWNDATVHFTFPKGIMIQGMFQDTFPNIIGTILHSQFETIQTGATIGCKHRKILSEHVITVRKETTGRSHADGDSISPPHHVHQGQQPPQPPSPIQM